MADQRHNAKMDHVDLYVTPALFYIETLVKALNKKNSKAIAQELNTVCGQQGPSANRHLLQTLFAGLDFSSDPQLVIKTKDFHQALPVQVLVQQVATLFDLPLFKTVLHFCFERPFDLLQEAQFLSNAQLIPLCGRIFKFNREQENRLCILLLKSNIPHVRNQAATLIKQKFGDILKSYCDADERLLQDTDKTVFHELLLLLENGQREEFAERVSAEQEEEFRGTLKRLYPHPRLIPLQLRPILLGQNYADSDPFEVGRLLEMSRNPPKVNLDSDHDLLVRLLIEFGYKSIENLESCRSCLGGIGMEYVTPESVARCIGVLASIVAVDDLSPEELETIELDRNVRSTGYYIMWSRSEMKTVRTEMKEADGKRMDNCVIAICEKCPSLSWREVVYEMDHEGFFVFDRTGLQLVLLGLFRGLQNTSFPIELLYRHWTNSDAQLAWFTHALKNPDIFCFAEYQCDRADMALLKSHPDEYRQREYQVWLCLDLVETLLYLADSGFSQEVLNLMETPLLRCPDILLITLLQLSPSTAIVSSRTRQQLVRLCVQKFLFTHPNSQVVLHYAWTLYPNNKLWAQQLMIDAMSDWYITGRYDQLRLTRILDVAQDLKALGDLLQCDILPFVIDLACLAARREFLKLDKWMLDKMAEHGAKFVIACLKFLERRCPTLVSGDPLRDEQSLPRNAQLPSDTVNTFLRHLQDALTNLNISFDTITTIMKFIKNASAVPKRPNPPPSVLKQQAPSPSDILPMAAQGLSSLEPLQSVPDLISSTAVNNPGPIRPPAFHTGSIPSARSFAPSPSPFSPPPPTNINHDLGLLSPSKSAFSPPIPISSLERGSSSAGSKTLSSGSNDLYGMLPEVRKSYPQDVEQEVYKYFQSMFTGSIPMASLIEKMRIWKGANSERDRLLFDCIMRNVYEEHQWLHQYPDKEFEITARFFGMLIDNQFLSYMGLGIALRQLLDFLRMGPSHRHFHFAVFAMEMFKERLHEYSQYCHHVTQTPFFKDFSASLKEYVISGTRAEKPSRQISLPTPTLPSDGTKDRPNQSLTAGRSSAQRVVSPNSRSTDYAGSNSDESDSEDVVITVPPETVRDKLGFLFNNISMSNVKDKTTEFKELLKGEDGDKYTRWIADYIVMKRAGQENNFHPLYFVFMQQIEMPRLYTLVVRETVHNIKSLLQTEKSADKFHDRTLLKNLGAWLGFMTIAMNRPIRSKDLDMKALIVEAYHKGLNELYYAIPLVTKILCLCSKSKLFGKQNPWIKTILSLLGAIHAEPETKLNLKFEVEVLAKTLDLNVTELGDSPLLKNDEYVRWVMQFGQQLFGAPAKRGKQHSGVSQFCEPLQFNTVLWSELEVLGKVSKELSVDGSTLHAEDEGRSTNENHQQSAPPGPPPPPLPPMQLQAGPTPSGFRFHYKDLHPPQFQSTFTKIVFNRDVGILQADMTIRNALRIAVERTLQDFLMPCVERCMRIVVPAALVIARKDFCLDGDLDRMRSAAIVMVRHLASGLSFATMREHLYNALVTAAKTHIMPNLRTQVTEEIQNGVTKACEVFAKDNLELCSAFLQKAAAERCIMEIKNTLTEEVKRRSDAKAEGKVWYNEDEAKLQRERIPASLRLEPGGEIREQQLAVYEHFAKSVPGFMTDAEMHHQLKMQEQLKMQMFVNYQRQQLQQQSLQQPGQKSLVQDVKEEDFMLLCEGTVQKLTGHVAIMSNLIPNAADNRHLQLTIGLKNKIQDCRALIRVGGAKVAQEIIQYIVEILLEGLSPEVLQSTVHQQAAEHHTVPAQDIVVRFKDACVSVLSSFQDPKMFGMVAVFRVVMQTLMTNGGASSTTFPHIKASSFETFNVLIRSRMIVANVLDRMLSRIIDSTSSRDAIGLAQQLIKMFCVDDKITGLCGESDLFLTIEAFFRFCTRHNDVQFPAHFLMDEVKVDLSACRRYDQRRDAALENPVLASHMHQAIVQVRDFAETMAIREKAENLLRLWYTMVNGPLFGPAMHAIEKSSEPLPQAMELVRSAFQRVFQDVQDVLGADDHATRFFKTCIEVCARDCYRMVVDQPPANVMLAQDQMRLKMAPMLDALSRLLVLIVRFTSEASLVMKLPWLRDPATATAKMLGIIAGVMFSHQESYDVQFLAYPFHRIIYSFFMDLFITEFKFVQIQEQIMLCFCNMFHAIRPQRLPAFTASWLELIFHRDVIRRINEIPEKKGWEMFMQLLVDSIKFVGPFVRNLTLNRPLSVVFRALLRFLYTLLHDYPEVLAEYYCVLVDVIPTNCLNMRNVVLSAAPIAIATDDPYSASFKIEDQKGIDFLPPRIVTRYHMFLQPISFRNDLDSYLNSRAPVTFLADLLSRLETSRTPGHKYHVQMLNALVLYLGQQAVANLTQKGVQISSTTVAHSSHTDIIQNLAINFDNEGRYLLVNALVNHLRYPNIHTHYYYCVILHLFRDMSNHQQLQELIVRVLLERITSHRPHPWGLVATCTQVIRGPEYGFFEKDFVNFNDDLFRLPIFRVIEGLPSNKMKQFYNDDQQQQRLPGSASTEGPTDNHIMEAEIRSAGNFSSSHMSMDGPGKEAGVKADSDFE